MLYVIHCFDKADHLQVRMDNRPAHVEFLQSYAEEAASFASSDPYANAGLFEHVVIQPWKKVLP